ncbi:MAG: hypothetical protein JST04_03220 [Bdellovibrionales bacterium]|nr:hypothetical protein [Bdellovibrionales bacterium]
MRELSRSFIRIGAVFLLLSGSGCGKLFENNTEGTTLGQTDAIEGAGVSAAASVTITPTGKDLAILSVSSIGSVQTATAHVATNDVVFHLTLRSENDGDSEIHLQELARSQPTSGVVSLDSALGCRYRIADKGTPKARLSSVNGSCVSAVTVDLPDHDIPRAFLGTTPLFSGEIALDDLKAVYAAAGFSPNLVPLLKTYVARLEDGAKPLSVADVAAFLPQLADDARRIEGIAAVAARVSDPENAEGLPKDAFTTAANRDRAVKILSAFAN